MKKSVFFWGTTSILSVLIACTSTTALNAQTFKNDAAKLSQEESQYRKKIVSSPRYILNFDFDSSSTSYTGSTEVKFVWLGTPSDTLWLDFYEGEVSELRLNSRPVDFVRTKSRILIAGEFLSKGENLISLKFKHDYSADGEGLYRFTDPEDKAVYIYSALEPFAANKVFPNFDQPDLKGIYEMTIRAPKDWSVVAYDRETVVNAVGNQKEWIFPKSLPFSTYIWSIHAGPFRVWNDDKARIPSRLLARKSLARYVNPQAWFDVTRQGMDFYEKYFDEPYAFKKYDQIVVPDFHAGAMENVGAVSFSEHYISRGKELHSQSRSRAEVILHEMAHMWFGNLVTMEWWNDLWLNESFATYMAFLAMSKATEFSGEESWRDFHGEKTWAYWTDLLVTSHPIEAKIDTTDDAFVNFDGITYGKGASMMKQLDFFIGPENFQTGIQLYFNRHRYSNTRLENFIAALEEASKRDLKRWSKEWLKTRGLNSVSFKAECVGGKLSGIQFEQSVANGDSLSRSQRTKLGLYTVEKDVLKLIDTLEIEYSGSSGTLASEKSLACPQFIFSNMDDEAYLIPSYSEADIRLIIENYTAFESPFIRQMLVHDLWLSTRRAEISLSAFSELIYKAVGVETDADNLQSLLGYLKNRHGGSSIYAYTHFAGLEGLESFEDLIWELLRKSQKNSEAENILKKFYLGFAMSQNHQKNLIDILNPALEKRLAMRLDQDDRWRAIQQLAASGNPRATELMDKELARDSSHKGHQSHLAAQAKLPDKALKTAFFQQLVTNDPPRTSEQVGIIAGALFPSTQRDLESQFQDAFFEALEKVRGTFEPDRLGNFLALIPEECFQGKVGKIQDYLKTAKNLQPIVEKELRISDQEFSICRRMRARDAKKTK
jgi:aminopeptidase N